MEEDKNFDIERRIRHLEREVVSMGSLLVRNSEILDDIRKALNKPVNWAEWIMASVGLAGGLASVIWAAFIVPLDARVDVVHERSVENRAHIRDIGDYAKEAREVIDAHLIRVEPE